MGISLCLKMGYIPQGARPILIRLQQSNPVQGEEHSSRLATISSPWDFFPLRHGISAALFETRLHTDQTSSGVAKFCWGTLMASEWVGMLNKHRFHACSPRWNQPLAYDCCWSSHLKCICAPSQPWYRNKRVINLWYFLKAKMKKMSTKT